MVTTQRVNNPESARRAMYAPMLTSYPGPRTRGVRRTWAILGGLSRHEDFTETRS